MPEPYGTMLSWISMSKCELFGLEFCALFGIIALAGTRARWRTSQARHLVLHPRVMALSRFVHREAPTEFSPTPKMAGNTQETSTGFSLFAFSQFSHLSFSRNDNVVFDRSDHTFLVFILIRILNDPWESSDKIQHTRFILAPLY
jgi:hypothetical protein